jgi:YebC/PmpR family DNA-binding regulatory protein
LFAVLIRQIEVAARAGGGDPEANATLRTMIQKARDNSVPADTIQRAIKRGTGEEEGVTYEQISYEGYAAHGVAVYVQALTDNRNRTGAEIRNLFTRNGGSFAEPGAVSWQFDRKGIALVPKSAASEDDLMLLAADAGAEDISDGGDNWEVVTPPTELHAVRTALEEGGTPVASSDLVMVPTTTVELGDEGAAKSVLRLVEALEDHDDVEAVYANFDIPDAVLEAVNV